jgi:peptidoglycan/xylan/chitin deacetylase (PgdA/CDA1 family)
MRRLLESPAMSPILRPYSGIASCLLYHRVTDQNFDPAEFHPNIGLSVHRDAFEEQIRYLSERHLCLSLPDAVDNLRNGTLKRGSVIVTFDDGYLDNMTHALPILERYGVPATIYVSTALVDGSLTPWWYEQESILREADFIEFSAGERHVRLELGTAEEKYRAAGMLFDFMRAMDLASQGVLMNQLRSFRKRPFEFAHEMLTWDQVRELDRHPLITIGAHTINHPVLRKLSEDELLFEARGSKLILEERLNHPVLHFSYPFGSLDDAGVREYQLSAECGFHSAFTSNFGPIFGAHAAKCHSLPRITIDYRDDFDRFRWKLLGIEYMIKLRGRRQLD